VPEPEYVYRWPRWTNGPFVAFLFAPPLLFAIAAGILDRSWVRGVGLALPVLVAALGCLWLGSKARIVIDSERIRWPLKRSELRWDDVATARLTKVLGTEYARVETKHGKVRRIVLNRVGGEEYRARVLDKLGLS